MNEYRVSVIDFNDGTTHGKLLFDRYANGIKEARSFYPSIKAHYSYNAKAFIGWKDGKNLVIKKC